MYLKGVQVPNSGAFERQHLKEILKTQRISEFMDQIEWQANFREYFPNLLERSHRATTPEREILKTQSISDFEALMCR